jgi:phytoene desaturase (3,4-didehydrolycopene-forming)
VKIGERLGVTYRFSTSVSRILLSSDNKTATGVLLETGEEMSADIIISNADLVYAYKSLLPPSSTAKSLDTRKASCSSISFYWALDRKIPELTAHNIFLADEYRESFDAIFKKQSLPDQPSFYVNVPSRVDPSAAPPGCDSIVVLCPVGHLMSSAEGRGLTEKTTQDWDALISRARSAVLRDIESRIGANLSSHITKELINTPLSWKETFNLDKGAILGLSHSFFNVLAFRPSTKHASIKNMYFCGASTHPGTGVPIVLAGSKITSEQILGDLGMDVPWGRGYSLQEKEGKKGRIDEVRSSPLLSWVHWVLLAVVVPLFAVLFALGLDRRSVGWRV